MNLPDPGKDTVNPVLSQDRKRNEQRNTSYNYMGNETKSINIHILIRNLGIFT